MTAVKFGRSSRDAFGHHRWTVWAARLALIISALISLMTGIGQARAAPGEQEKLVAAVLYVHNQVRLAANVPPLIWSDRLAQGAAHWANRLAHTGYMVHSDSKDGENIWMGTAGAFSYDLMVADWASEGRFYRAGYFPDNSSTGKWQDVGHFTQMVWRDSRQVGCAVASRADWDVLVCRYNSPGNQIGRKPY